MKIGIRATLQALLEADDLIAGQSLGASALTLVRRYRSQQESARTMRNGIERLKHELNEAERSERAALAKFDGARDAADNLRAQIVGLGFEHDDLVRERDALREQSRTFESQRDAFERQLASVVASYNAAQLALTDARAKWEADERTYLRDCRDIAKQRDEALHNLKDCEARWAADIKDCDCTSEDDQ